MTDEMIEQIRMRAIKLPGIASDLSQDVRLLLEEVAGLKAEKAHWEAYAHRLEEQRRSA